MNGIKNNIAEIVTGEFVTLSKVVILGFISLDFFNPLTFKFIAGIYEGAKERTYAFIAFKALYLTLPLLFYITYQVFAKRYFDLKGYITTGLKNAKPIYYGMAVFLLIILTTSILVSVPNLNHLFPGPDQEALTIACVIMIISCSGLFGGYYLFDRAVSQSKKAISWGKRKEAFRAISISFVSTLVGLFILFIMFDHRSGENNSIKNNTLSIFEAPFYLQDTLELRDSCYAEIHKIDKEINKKILFTEYHLKKYSSGSLENNNTEKARQAIDLIAIDSVKGINDPEAYFLKHPSRLPKIISASLTPVSSMLVGNNGPPKRLDSANTRLQVARSFMTYYKYTYEGLLNNMQKKAMNAAIALLTHVQLTDLMILLCMIFSLYTFYRMRSLSTKGNSKTIYLKSVIIIYVLMFVQMLKPVDPNHINLKDPSWPFTYSNWYLPGFVQSIGTINNIAAPLHTENIYPEPAEIDDLKIQIEALAASTFNLARIIKIELKPQIPADTTNARYKKISEKINRIRITTDRININTRKTKGE